MRKNAFVARDHIAAVNIFRQAMQGNSFTKETLKNKLREAGIPANNTFISELRRSPVLTQTGRDQFKFAYDQPVYWGILDRVYKDYQIRTRAYRENYKKKKQQELLAESAQVAQQPRLDFLPFCKDRLLTLISNQIFWRVAMKVYLCSIF